MSGSNEEGGYLDYGLTALNSKLMKTEDSKAQQISARAKSTLAIPSLSVRLTMNVIFLPNKKHCVGRVWFGSLQVQVYFLALVEDFQ